MAKFCTNCGKEIDENAVICVHCGVQVKANNGNVTMSEEDIIDKKAKNALTFGLISIVAWIIPIIGYVMTILGFVNASKGMKSEKYKGRAIAGLVLSIIFFLASLCNSILGVISTLS